MAEFIAVVGAIASCLQILRDLGECKRWICGLPTVTDNLQRQSKALLDVAESARRRYAGRLSDDTLNDFWNECKDLHNSVEELRAELRAGHHLLRQLRKAPSWKARKGKLDAHLKEIYGYLSIFHLTVAMERPPTDMGSEVPLLTSGDVYNMPRCHSLFFGYSEYVALVVEKLSRPGLLSSVALVGRSGTGKSRVARECILRIKECCPATSIFWVDASSEMAFEKSFLAFSTVANNERSTLPRSKTLQDIMSSLDSIASQCLLVLDGFDDSSTLFGQRRFVDMLPRCRILYTTQDKRTVFQMVRAEDMIVLRGLCADEAQRLFRHFNHNTLIDPKELASFLADLAYSPSAIRHAGSYISMARLNVSAYAELQWGQDTKTNDPISSEFPYADSLCVRSSRQSFDLTYQAIRSRYPLAAEVLKIAAVLHRGPISRRLVAQILDRTDIANVNEAFGTLDAFSLLEQRVKPRQEDLFELQHSTQLHLRARSRTFHCDDNLHLRIVARLLEILPNSNQIQQLSILPIQPILYAREILQQMEIGDGLPTSPTLAGPCGSLALRVAAYLRSKGTYESSIRYAEIARNYLDLAHGPESRESLKARSSMAESIELSGDLSKAEEQWRQLLEIAERVYHSKDIDTIAAMNNLGIALHGRGEFKEAEKMYREVLSLDQEVQGAHELSMRTKHNLAITLQSQQRYEEAEGLYYEVLGGEKTSEYGKEISTLSTISNLGSLYHLQERWEDAWEMYQDAFNGRKDLLGPTHPDTIRTSLNMAAVLEAQHRFEESEWMARRGMEQYVDCLGTDHADTILAVRLLARVLYQLGRYGESERMSRTAFKASRKVFGKDHEDTMLLKAEADQLRIWMKEYSAESS